MNHPFIKDKNLFLVYSAIWVIITIIHVAAFYFLYIDNLVWAVSDSLVFNLLFFLLGFILWYPLEYYKVKESKAFNLIINHLSVLAFVGFIWLGASYNILSWMASDNEAYSAFLYNTLFFRGISGFFYYSIIVLIYYILSYYKNLQEKISNEARLQELLKIAELNFLKAQINPHFLFNSLNSVSSLTLSSPQKAQEMIIKLSDFLRYVISQSENKPVMLQDEIENIRRYLEIEKVRFGDKLNFEFISDEASADKHIPVLILQPLYENAVKHGVYESINPICISTHISYTDDYLIIQIKNNYEAVVAQFKGAGIGLKNIRERLRLMYMNPDLLIITKTEKEFIVELRIPQQKVGSRLK